MTTLAFCGGYWWCPRIASVAHSILSQSQPEKSKNRIPVVCRRRLEGHSKVVMHRQPGIRAQLWVRYILVSSFLAAVAAENQHGRDGSLQCRTNGTFYSLTKSADGTLSESMDAAYLRTANGTYRLDMSAVPDEKLLPSGTSAVVAYDAVNGSCTDRPSSSGAAPPLLVKEITSAVPKAAPSDAVKHGAKAALESQSITDASTLFIIVDWSACRPDAGPSVTKQALQQVLFGPGPSSLSSYYQTCSYGRAQLDASNSMVVGPVAMPCSGTSSLAGTWSVNTCQGSSILGWVDAASSIVQRQLGVDVWRYQYRVLILPAETYKWQQPPGACSFAGLSIIRGVRDNQRGDTYGAALISGSVATDMAVYFHELGHSMGLYSHASTTECTHCDPTSAMGSRKGTGNLCYNAAQNEAIGWSEPIAALDISAIQPGSPIMLTVYSQLSRSSSYVRLDGMSAPLYISHRTNVAPSDTPFLANYPKGVTLIHTFDPATAGTMLLAQLSADGQKWQDTKSGTGLVITRVTSGANGGSSLITLCLPGPGAPCDKASLATRARRLLRASA